MFRVAPTLISCDMHPDYLSSRYARELASKSDNLKLEFIQHHHAHIASCMAENHLDEKVIGISMDGVGYGTDGNIWGFETMVCDLEDFERKSHLDYVMQPGGDKANMEPWRMAVSYLYKYIGPEFTELNLPFLDQIDRQNLNIIMTALEHRINCPLTSSAGRLFDAVAALAGICNYSSFHAEAPMRLENLVDPDEQGAYPFEVSDVIDPKMIIRGIVDDILNDIPDKSISTKFHRTIIEIICYSALIIHRETGIGKVVLSGGTFQNRFILEEVEPRLRSSGLEVYTHVDFPSNDGGIALGQLIIAAKRRQKREQAT